ncbi:hypothetical protein CPB85DRAFT_1309465, partial [Mucidula mucida]
MYARRSEITLLWNLLLVDGKRLLAYVDVLGTTHSTSTVPTGYGVYLLSLFLAKPSKGL